MWSVCYNCATMVLHSCKDLWRRICPCGVLFDLFYRNIRFRPSIRTFFAAFKKFSYWWLEKQADSWRNHMAGMQILKQYRTLVLWTPIQPDSLFPYIFLEVGTTVRFWGLWNFGTSHPSDLSLLDIFKNITLFALQRCASKASKTGRLCAVQSLSTTRLCYTFFYGIVPNHN